MISFNSNTIQSIHPIEYSQNHYTSLQKLSTSERLNFARIDTLAYPPYLYKKKILLFALAKPYYLTSSQVDYLVKSVYESGILTGIATFDVKAPKWKEYANQKQ